MFRKISQVLLLFLAGLLISACVGKAEKGYYRRTSSSTSTPTPTPTPIVKRVFQTSTIYNGNLGGLAGADAICAARATAAGLTGSWLPWLSDEGTDALTRIVDESPWYLMDSTTVAVATLADLSNPASILGITQDEFGANVTGVNPIWTGTLNTGLVSANRTCDNWTKSVAGITGADGINNGGAGTWANNGNNACNLTYSLYCFEQTAAPAAAPAPPVRRVFQTSTTYNGNIGGLAGADAACAARATAAGLTGNWVPFLSDEGTSAVSRVLDFSPWYLIDGVTVAVNTAADLANPASIIGVVQDEFGANVTGVNPIWTGSLNTGAISPGRTCDNWTKSIATVTSPAGINNGGAGTWANNANAGCNQTYSIYCFEQALAPAAAAAPPVRRIFQTSTTYDGNLAGLAGADAACAARATAAGLTGNWVPWLSDEGTNAVSRVIDFSPWYLIDGVTVAVPTLATLSNPASIIGVVQDEFGANVTGANPIWTGTLNTGLLSAGNTCHNWTKNSVTLDGDNGINNGGAGTWTNNANNTCNQTYSLYCIEQGLAPAAAAAPPRKRVFQTSTTYDGNLGGIVGADAACAARAGAAALGGSWRVWISDDVTAANSRILDFSPWYLVDNVTLTVNTAAVLSNPASTINITQDEFGAGVATPVWTGTLNTGLSDVGQTCNNWTDNTIGFTGDNGTNAGGAGQWTNNGSITCDQTYSLYCFEQ